MSKNAEKSDEMTYEQHSVTFTNDYHRANPMTQMDANITFLTKLKDEGLLQQNQYNQQVSIYQKGGRFGGVVSYGEQAESLQNRMYYEYQPEFVRSIMTSQLRGGMAGVLGVNHMQGVPQNYSPRRHRPALGRVNNKKRRKPKQRKKKKGADKYKLEETKENSRAPQVRTLDPNGPKQPE